jgi:hypothetical protein
MDHIGELIQMSRSYRADVRCDIPCQSTRMKHWTTENATILIVPFIAGAATLYLLQELLNFHKPWNRKPDRSNGTFRRENVPGGVIFPIVFIFPTKHFHSKQNEQKETHER